MFQRPVGQTPPADPELNLFAQRVRLQRLARNRNVTRNPKLVTRTSFRDPESRDNSAVLSSKHVV
jgi:hypothetical protein